MYQYQNSILSIPAKLLYEDWALMSYDYYKQLCFRKKLIRTKEGKGKGNTPWVSYPDLPEYIKAICLEKFGRPEDVVVLNLLEPYIVPDTNAAKFFAAHLTPDGKRLSEMKQRQRTINCSVLNAIQTVFKDKGITDKMFGRRKTRIWANLSDAVNMLNAQKWAHNLPGAAKRLREKYESYIKVGYSLFIHKGEGNQNTAKIRDQIADFILANYSLPIKLTVPMVMSKYNEVKAVNEWPDLTESGIYNWLYEPKQERLWTLGRHGKQAYNNKFQHTLSRDKSNWFPNVYWAIDGTKLDWIHFDDTTSNKMGAKLRINVMFDVYSEKIIGWSLSETEDHTDHFRAIKSAVKQSGCKPYLLTYDSQSGHKMVRMQELYSNIVATAGGTHHVHRVGQKNNPAEQLFKRFQQQVITKFWFSDGQSIKVRRDDNKPNIDFIEENKHLLKPKADLLAAWEYAVNQWNTKKHPHFLQSRNEVYSHPMPMRESLSIEDTMQYMWIEESKKHITYKKDGLTIWLSNTQYQYEVYNADGSIDLEFRRKNVGRKFIVRYDPESMSVYIQLYEVSQQGEKIFIAYAQPKRKHVDIPILMQDGDKEQWANDFAIRDEEFRRDSEALKALLNRTGITPDTLIEEQELAIKFKGNAPKRHAQTADIDETAIMLSRM